MLSYILSFFNNIFTKNIEEDDESKEDFLAEQLMELEAASEENKYDQYNQAPEIPRNAACFQRTGIITYIAEGNNYVLIDGMLYFDLSACSVKLNINDKIVYLGYKDANESMIVVRILENQGLSWADDQEVEEDSFKVIEHIIVGEVDYRQDRFVYIKDSDLKFSLDDVEGALIPIKGDWLELKCNVQLDDDKPSNISAAQVLKVISIRPLRQKVKNAVVTEWSGESGTCDRNMYFNRLALQNNVVPQLGSKVLVEAIESNQGTCTWRVVKLVNLGNPSFEENTIEKEIDDDISAIENANNISVTHPLQFYKVDIHETAHIPLTITNNSNNVKILNKWIMLSKKRDSQVQIEPFLSYPRKIFPNQTFSLKVQCCPKFLGATKECLILMFKGFQVKRYIKIDIVDANVSSNCTNGERNGVRFKSERELADNLKKMRSKNNSGFVPGVRPCKPPAFIPVKLGNFTIPEKVWSAVLGNSEQTVYGSDYRNIIDRIESNLPCLMQELNITNYIDKWHTLLYMEEIQANINIRAYDMPKAFLIRCQEYLSLEIKGLAEKRPSLIKGDRVLVKDIWNNSIPEYEGYIHCIKNDLILMKFNQQFHESYCGSDVSVEFHFNRSVYRRSHQAINLALSNLGQDILFPQRITRRAFQVPSEKLKNIKWFNNSLNSEQKSAVTNILLGECRPMPYCIYGPPGTGKTITVLETILQIITHLPDSRILVATPSNSAANLITERLLEYRSFFPDSIIRLIAHYLVDSETLPEVIKPYCATMDIAREDTWKSRHTVQNGIKLNCPMSYLGRHRVTIGTCYCIGSLAQVGLPKGHFTHIIVDEAGQATEPEIMIPLTFLDKDNGQIILAGDPMQLGPVILSKYCKEFGMDESYLSRLLETFPYQRDYDAYSTGFDNRLVTKLNDNYRSLEGVLTLPSEMFYDSSLVVKIDPSQQWITKILDATAKIFDTLKTEAGGIYVYGIKGGNYRAADSPSWYNPHEASMLALTTCKLYKRNITADEIGIITPYIAQVRHIKLLFEAMGLPEPKIGTVEEFQGQERPIILISTVRSSASHLMDDQKHTLGFVKHPKRLNVALTRAQVAVLLFCDPHLLRRDHLWSKVINQAVSEEKYTGCDLPYHTNDNEI